MIKKIYLVILIREFYNQFKFITMPTLSNVDFSINYIHFKTKYHSGDLWVNKIKELKSYTC